jgi:hypothetical protein
LRIEIVDCGLWIGLLVADCGRASAIGNQQSVDPHSAISDLQSTASFLLLLDDFGVG